jgi:predicted  nucleic acid-binding Zn-ribbon protein
MATRQTKADLEKKIEELVKKLAGAHQELIDEERAHEKALQKLRDERTALTRERDDLKDRLKREEGRVRQALDAAEDGCAAAGANARVNLLLMQHIDWMERGLETKPRNRRRAI